VDNNRNLWTATYLSVFVCWFFSAAFVQAATFNVNSTLDVADINPGNGICETAPGNGTCTLRAAIQETNALPGADGITLPTNTYLLTIVSELGITSSLTITGSGASSTIIDGNKSVRPNSRVLGVGSGIIVNISGVTIRNGRTAGVGGGISNSGALTLTNSTLSENSADQDGGGIYNANGGTATLTNLTVSGNTAGDDGGGIRNAAGGTLTLTNSTVSGNDAGDDGGGIRNGGTVNIIGSTIANNRAGLNSLPTNVGGGGVHNFGGTVTLTNSTVSGNVARTDGGGIFIEAGTVNSFSSTIANNRADANSTGSGRRRRV